MWRFCDEARRDRTGVRGRRAVYSGDKDAGETGGGSGAALTTRKSGPYRAFTGHPAAPLSDAGRDAISLQAGQMAHRAVREVSEGWRSGAL